MQYCVYVSINLIILAKVMCIKRAQIKTLFEFLSRCGISILSGEDPTLVPQCCLGQAPARQLLSGICEGKVFDEDRFKATMYIIFSLASRFFKCITCAMPYSKRRGAGKGVGMSDHM